MAHSPVAAAVYFLHHYSRYYRCVQHRRRWQHHCLQQCTLRIGAAVITHGLLSLRHAPHASRRLHHRYDGKQVTRAVQPKGRLQRICSAALIKCTNARCAAVKTLACLIFMATTFTATTFAAATFTATTFAAATFTAITFAAITFAAKEQGQDVVCSM